MSIESPVNAAENKVGPGFDEIIVTSDQTSQDWSDSAELEFEVFRDAEYVKTAEELTEEYAPYSDRSKFITVRRRGEVVGSTRIVLPGDGGFKTLEDAEKGKLTITDEGREILGRYDLSRQGLEVGTLAVKDGFRTGPFHAESVSASLYAGITAYTGILARKLGRPERGFVLASFDEEYLEGFTGAFGDSVMQLGPSQEYMGSKTTPVMIDVDKLLDDDFQGLTPLLLGLAELVKDDE